MPPTPGISDDTVVAVLPISLNLGATRRERALLLGRLLLAGVSIVEVHDVGPIAGVLRMHARLPPKIRIGFPC